jgi:uncharacterized protein DUF4329
MSIPMQEKETARAALRSINPVSIRENVEYGVVIYRDRQRYGATRPFTSHMRDGLLEADILEGIRSRPAGSRFVALCHTHGNEVSGTFSLIFSPEDIATARRFSVNAYLATPNGELVTFSPGGRDEFPRERL